MYFIQVLNICSAIIEIFINARINILFDLKDGFGGMTKTVR